MNNSPAHWPDEPRSAYNVLLIDDDTLWGFVIRQLLTQPEFKLPVTLSIATSIPEGFRKMDEEYFDVILLDLNLNDPMAQTGLDLFKSLQQIDNGAETVFMSGEADPKKLLDVFRAGVRNFSPSRPEAADADAEATVNVAASALGYRAAALSCMVFMGISLFANEFGSHFTNGVPPSIDSNQSASERQSAAIKRRSWGLSTCSQSFLSCTSVLPGTPCPKGWREISKKPCTDSEDQGRAWNHLAAPRQGIAPCRILNSGCCQSVGKIKRP